MYVVTNIKFDKSKLISNLPFETVIFVDKESQYNRQIKTNVIHFAPFERGAYLDCDIEIRGSMEPIFKCLDNFDVAMKLNVLPTKKDYDVAPGIPGYLFPVWNGGVIFFRNNNRAKALFQKWTQIYNMEGKGSDQPALARAVYDTPDVRLLSLNMIWNTFPRDIELLPRGIKQSRIWHYRKPNKQPAVAPVIYRLHKSIADSITDYTLETREEIKNVHERYKYMASLLYRYSKNQSVISNLIRILRRKLEKIGIIRRPNYELDRNSRRAGEDYQNIKG